jgi:hypothetical protein
MNATTQNSATAFALTSPLLLNNEQQENPYLFLNAFFEFASIEEYKEEMSEWFRTAVSEGVIYEGANNLLFLHSQITQLLNAGFLIASKEQHSNSANTFLRYVVETLTIEAITGIRYGLREWLFSALSMECDLSNVEHQYSFALYDRLLKIIEALHEVMIDDTTLNEG